MDQSAQLQAITETVRTYVEGLVEGDAEKLRQAMHENACEIGYYQGELLWQDREAMIAMIEEEGATPDFDPDWQIETISLDGDVASVRVEDIWLGTRFIDTLTLLRIDGRWQIVAKVFHIRPEY